jgi:hypothetical protein
MTHPRYVPIEWNNATLSWNSICGDCKELLFMLTKEATINAPRRPSGSTALLPVTMSIHHECWGSEHGNG